MRYIIDNRPLTIDHCPFSIGPPLMANKYIQVIDLTNSGSKNKAEQATDQEPESSLPSLTLDQLPDTLQRAVRHLGWPSLMPVQAKAIPYALEGRDLIVQSRTGSGKTGAFLLPLLTQLDPQAREAQALVLAPTRELAKQIHDTFEAINAAQDKNEKFRSVLIYGGVGYKGQINAIENGAQVVIGTPGRILDHLERRTLTLDTLRVLILDEADEMLSMGFYPAMKQLRRYLPHERLSYMFSATMPYKVQMLGDQFLRDAGFLRIGDTNVETMEHEFLVVDPKEKNRVLLRLIELQNPDTAIIFANTRRQVDFLYKMLRNYGFDVEAISGDLRQREREKIMQRMRDGSLRLLVATDVAARGIDVSAISHIFQYDVPQDPEYYVHRAGRTARAGKSGQVITLASLLDQHGLNSLARRYGIELTKVPTPTKEEVETRVIERVTELLENRLRSADDLTLDRLPHYLSVVTHLIEADQLDGLALLVDEYYHQSLHRQVDAPNPDEPEAQEPESELPSQEDLAVMLTEHLGNKSLLKQERLNRFLPLVHQLIEAEELEPLALLLDGFHIRSLNPPLPPPPVREKIEKRRGPRSHRRGGRSGGRSQGRRRGRR